MSKCRHDWAPYDTSYKAGGWEGEICVKCGEEKVAPDPRDATIARLEAEAEAFRTGMGSGVTIIPTHDIDALRAELATLKARLEAAESFIARAVDRETIYWTEPASAGTDLFSFYTATEYRLTAEDRAIVRRALTGEGK